MPGMSKENRQKRDILLQKRRKNNILILFFILLLPIFTYGQAGPDFSISTDKAFHKLYQNPEDCISYSQSILISDKNPEHKMILRKIISQAYAMQGNYVQAVNISNQKEDDHQGEALSHFIRLFGDYNLADQYQNLGLYGQSEKIITRVLADRELLKSQHQKERMTIAKLFQLQAINSGVTRKYETALEYLDQSDRYLDGNNEENRIIRQENTIFRATFLMKLNRLEESKKLLDHSIQDIENNGNDVFLAAFAYESISRYFFLKEDYTAAVKYLDEGFSKIKDLPYHDMKVIFYDLYAKNYLALNNDEKYHYYNNLYTELKTKIDSSKKEGIQYIVKLVETYHHKDIEFQRQNKLSQFKGITAITLFFIIAAVAYFLYESGRSKDLKKQLGFFEKLREKENAIPAQAHSPETGSGKVNKSREKDSPKISKEKEDEILQKLKEWEQTDNYLNKNMSISALSAQTGINTKYLSEVINSHKEKNFNSYINELRINHIAHLLKTDPAYLNYKVSYLAEHSGFSSHGAFTNVFKSITGMSPNTYIQEIIKNKRS